jgi:hypothetical protein
MQAHGPAILPPSRILDAARIAKKLGAQIVGVGMLPKALKDASEEVAKHAVLPITTGNSYFASATLWASAEAVRRMGLSQAQGGQDPSRQGDGDRCHRGRGGDLLPPAWPPPFEEVHLVGRNIAKLLALQESHSAGSAHGEAAS